MNLRVCFLGRPAAGSFQARAVQVAACREGWSAASAFGPELVLAHDLFVFVKWAAPRPMHLLRGLGKRVVFDLLDGWEQPADDRRVRDLGGARALYHARWGEVPADAVIYATRAMQEDLEALFPPGRVIYHHFRPGLEPVALRETPRLVGYEGEERYLGPWRGELERACRAVGLTFVVNPPDLRQVDLGVAARGGDHDGWLSRRYKSNVKLANLYGAGIPALVQAEAEAYRETACAGQPTFSTPAELRSALAALLPLPARRRLQEAQLAARPSFALPRIAAEYEALFAQLTSTASASCADGRRTARSGG